MAGEPNDRLALIRMRRIATTALIVVFCGMIGFRFLEPLHPAWGYLRAFCEAATVGALADWFAVVALFRHPMGIPIPHTAILPRNRDRVATSLADFIDMNFLSSAGIADRLRKLDFASIAASWLSMNREAVTNRLADILSSWLTSPVSDTASAWLAARAKLLVAEADISGLASATLGPLFAEGRGQHLYGILLRSAGDLIVTNRPTIQNKIREEIPLPVETLRSLPGLQRFGPALDQLRDQLASLVASRTIEKVQELLQEAGEDPDHALRIAFDAKLAGFIEDLKSSPEMQARVAKLQQEFSESETLDAFSRQAWDSIQSGLVASVRDSNSSFHHQISKISDQIITALESDLSLRSTINDFVSAKVLDAVSSIRPHVRDYVISTISTWDAHEIADKLEMTVGRDLQFIRLNGTIIGGFIGVLIHAGFAALGV
jgi:uncharacterized membrane-anchored protein YjiN (DUF445 family)